MIFDSHSTGPSVADQDVYSAVRSIVMDYSPRGMTLLQADAQAAAITRQILGGVIVSLSPSPDAAGQN